MNWDTLYNRSYTKYSGKPDAVIVADQSGLLYPGVRVENIAFPDTISAEQAALYSCLGNAAKPVRMFLRRENRLSHPLLDYWISTFELELIVDENIPDLPFFQPVLSSQEEMDTLLERLLDDAIVPYSHFPVSAILETDKGYVSGVNIECADWRLGLCAERVAITKALSSGITHFQALHVHTRYGEFSSPCGACRQVILEHMPGIPVYLHHADHTHSVHKSQDLLPYSFRSSELSTRYDSGS